MSDDIAASTNVEMDLCSVYVSTIIPRLLAGPGRAPHIVHSYVAAAAHRKELQQPGGGRQLRPAAPHPGGQVRRGGGRQEPPGAARLRRHTWGHKHSPGGPGGEVLL